MIFDNADEIIREFFESLLNKYQIVLKTSVRGSDFIFDSVNLLYYECHKINPNQNGSYIDSLDWFKKQKSNNKTHEYAITVTLNHEEIKKTCKE